MARKSSISSIFSSGVCFDLEYFISASGLNEIIDKCFLKCLQFDLNSNGIFALDKYMTSFFLFVITLIKFWLSGNFTFSVGNIISASGFLM